MIPETQPSPVTMGGVLRYEEAGLPAHRSFSHNLMSSQKTRERKQHIPASESWARSSVDR